MKDIKIEESNFADFYEALRLKGNYDQKEIEKLENLRMTIQAVKADHVVIKKADEVSKQMEVRRTNKIRVVDGKAYLVFPMKKHKVDEQD